LERLARVAFLGLSLSLSCAAQPAAAARVDVLRVDLEARIRQASASPSQFAVPVAHAVSAATAGTWREHDGRAQWRYTVEVPGAVSLSFYAPRVQLPPSAVLSVRGGAGTAQYRARDLHDGALWSRIGTGDLLELTLEVAAGERAAVQLQIAAFQAGYRGLGAGVADHPALRRLKLAAASPTDNSACVQNYACAISSANTAAAQATVGVVVANLYQCTGVLVNDAPGDNTPYLLTARHCQTGRLGGGNPGAAGTVTVYWNAVTACGQPLGSLYDPNVPVQTGATSLVEQQDVWLLRLDTSPVVGGAQFAGFDVSGTAVQGGYTVHHALGFDKQLVGWRGTALGVRRTGELGVTYTSDFWEVVNGSGNSGPGASGSGLFDAANHLVGTLTLGRNTADASGYESCPSPDGAAPNGSNGSNDFTSLAAVWNATSDPTGTAATLRSVLDPEGSGVLQTASAPAASMALSSGLDNAEIGTPLTLTWDAPGATQCTAAGGAAGDGWNGTLAGSGSQSLTESAPANLSYALTCALAGGRTVSATVTVLWGLPQAVASISAAPTVWSGRPVQITWSANVGPCELSGGSLSLQGLASSGVAATTQAVPATVQYQVRCGTAATGVAAATTQVSFVAPDVSLRANGTDRRLGEQFTLSWQSYADSCTPSGGAPEDGWTTTAFPDPAVPAQFAPQVSTAGTYTYTLTCFSGALAVSRSVVVSFEQNAPYVSASIDRSATTYTGTAADFLNLSWNSNLSSCFVESAPVIANSYSGTGPEDAAKLAPTPGTYTLDVFCQGNGNGLSASSAPLVISVAPPPAPTASLAITPATVDPGGHFTVSWSSAAAAGCTAAGAPGDADWQGALTTAGSRDAASAMVGNYTLTLSCVALWGGLPTATAQAALTVRPPATTAVSLTSTPASLPVGGNFTLSWQAQNVSGCTASGGGASGTPWTGALPAAGSSSQAASIAGTFTYLIACQVGSDTVEAQSTVTVVARAGAAPSGGGGGAADPAWLWGLALAVLARWRVQARAPARG
jgi:hypothetical protein